MDVSDPTRLSRAVRAALAATAVLVVAGLVAAAAGEDVPSGESRRPTDRALDLLFSFGVVTVGLALVAGAVVYALGWHLKLRHAKPDGPSSPLRSFVVLAFVVIPLVALAYFRRGTLGFGDAEVADVVVRAPAEELTGPAPSGYEPDFATIPVLIALGGLVAALVALWLTRRARRRELGPSSAAPPPPSLDDVLASTVDDLRAEPDPRRAVIAAYARLELALAAAGHPRRRSDAPGEYLGRVLREAEVSPAPVARLTSLFARAKFSDHEVGELMRAEAIDALEAIRADLQAAEAARHAALASGLTRV